MFAKHVKINSLRTWNLLWLYRGYDAKSKLILELSLPVHTDKPMNTFRFVRFVNSVPLKCIRCSYVAILVSLCEICEICIVWGICETSKFKIGTGHSCNMHYCKFYILTFDLIHLILRSSENKFGFRCVYI